MSKTGRFLSPTSSESYLNRSYSTKAPLTSRRMHDSASLADLSLTHRENKSIIRPPIVADLQNEYVKALNIIDTLKAENREWKVLDFISAPFLTAD